IIDRNTLSRILIEPAATDILHRVKDPTIRKRSDVMNRNDSGMFEPGNDLCFTNHPTPQIVSNVWRVKNLDCDKPAQLTIFREIDCSHPTAPELFYIFVLRSAEIRLADDRAQVIQPVIREPLHFTSTPSSERASVRNSSSVAVISRSFSRTMRRKSRRAAAR